MPRVAKVVLIMEDGAVVEGSVTEANFCQQGCIAPMYESFTKAMGRTPSWEVTLRFSTTAYMPTGTSDVQESYVMEQMRRKRQEKIRSAASKPAEETRQRFDALDLEDNE